MKRGKYQFKGLYSYLEVEEGKWFSMTSEQRVNHLSKVHSATVSAVCSPQMIVGEKVLGSVTLSVDVQTAAQGMNVPLTCMEGIWRKAAELTCDPKGMVLAPGQSPEARW